jgi:adenylate cyclase class 2
MKNNGIEIELKFLLQENPESFLKRFSKAGKRVYQKTVMFDNEQRLMKKTNGRIRLRQDGEITILSYKLPLSSNTVKKEIQWETKIDSWQVGKELLKAMGFKETTSYEKYRTSFEYKGSKIEIDEYPFANFIEIEGEEENIKKIALDLGFNLKKAITKPCDTLFNEWRAKKGLPPTNKMLFANYDK